MLGHFGNSRFLHFVHGGQLSVFALVCRFVHLHAVYIFCADYILFHDVFGSGNGFMPKPRLKAIIHDGQAEISASQVVLKIFSWTFLKRISMYFGLFVLEIACRIFGIRLFLQCADAALNTLETLAAKSDMLLIAVITVAALILMELPWYFLFYRVSFGNRANRSSEYRFGLRVFAFLLGVLVVQFMLQPFSVYYADNAAVQYLLVGLLIVASFGIWWLMYKKRWKKGACPLCNRVKSCFCVYEQPATDETEKKAE